MNDTLHKLLEAIEEAERASVHNQCHIGLDGWFEIVRLCRKLREEMAI